MTTTTQPKADQSKETVLIVNDDEAKRRQLVRILAAHYRVLEAASRTEAVRLLKEDQVDVMVGDLYFQTDLEDISEGSAIVAAARNQELPVQVVVIAGANSKRVALETIKLGAFGFFEKPLDMDELLRIVNQAARMRRLEIENARLRGELIGARGFGRLIGSSPSFEKILRQARAVANSNATVLITGENGTGKEMLARAIHEESSRANAPFVAVSCGALQETLIESELFGHEKGAFTSATETRKGRFELADGGTLFLDEVAELSPSIQVKLLRVLQERSFERVGGTKTLNVDIRLIAASNHDLEKEVASEHFRRDLFYRLNVVPLVLPPLRDRREDIPGLSAHFAAKAAAKHARATPQLDPKLIDLLFGFDWPGNVRELENLMERLVLLDRNPTLGLEFLPEQMLQVSPAASESGDRSFASEMSACKRRLIVGALAAEGGNKVAAAKRLGISRSYLHRLIVEFEL